MYNDNGVIYDTNTHRQYPNYSCVKNTLSDTLDTTTTRCHGYHTRTLRVGVCSDELINAVVDEAILLHALKHPRSLQLDILNSLKHIYHPLHTNTLNTETQGAEYP